MRHPFDKHYFHGGGKVGGYAGEGYRDFPVHWNTYAEIMKRNPESVLEFGCSRGYTLKRLLDWGMVHVGGLEISEHCYLTRALEQVTTHDITKVPWPAHGGALADPKALPDKAFDLCVSIAVLEHIPEDKLPSVFEEMARTCKRGLHGIDIHDDDHFDKTHHTIRPLSWWTERLPPGHEAVDKEDLEPAGPIALPPGIDQGVKLNLGSFTHMFHGWRNIDRIDLSSWAASNGYAFTHWDIGAGLPYDDGRVDLVFLSHVLEHFSYDDGVKLLREIRRVLRPKGVVRIAVPDIAVLARSYVDCDMQKFDQICGVDAASDPKLGADQPRARLFFELAAGGDHRAFYDTPALVNALLQAGFANVLPSGFRRSSSAVMRRETIDLYPDMSLFIEATP